MPRVIEGQLNADGQRIGIVVARFNSLIGNELLGGALDCLGRHGADTEQALERAGTKAGNKGWDAALGAIEMVNVIRSLEGSSS